MTPIRRYHAQSDGCDLRWHKRAYNKLVKFAGGWGIEVKSVELPDTYGELVNDVEPREIRLDTGMSVIHHVNYLLHELGHVELMREGLTETRFTGDDTNHETSSLLALLDEEFEAWERGRAIARRCGIKIDPSYDACKEFGLMSYVRWIASLKKEDK